MTSAIAEAFCLKAGRNNFYINFRVNEEDRRSYFGRSHIDQDLLSSIRSRYNMGMPPKKYLYGQYGAGKTHTLFNLKYQLEDSTAAQAETRYTVRCRVVEGEFKTKTTYTYLHSQMMEAISLDEARVVIQEWLTKNAAGDLQKKLREFFGDHNLARAIQAIGIAGEQITLWRWLCGGTLSGAELSSFGLTKNMNTVAETCRALTGICRLFAEKRIYYLFLLDEMEGLQNVDNADSQESFHDGLRRLADNENDVLGFILSIYAMSEDEFPNFIFRPDIVTRIGGANIHQLRYLGEEADVSQFLEGLFSLVIDPSAKAAAEASGAIPTGLTLYPFTDAALDQFVNLAVSAPTASLPRNIIDAVNNCAGAALDRGARVVDTQDLAPAQQIFREL